MEEEKEVWHVEGDSRWGWTVMSNRTHYDGIRGGQEPNVIAYRLGSKARAQLLASAPELLEVVKEMGSVMEDGYGCWCHASDHDERWNHSRCCLAALAAVKKAEGTNE